MKSIVTIVFVLASVLALTSSVKADSIKLDNGQVYKGEITAEEEGRVQMKLENNGPRLWFSRNQILEVDRTSPEKAKPAQKENKGDSSNLDDDVVRAQALLEKMREELQNGNGPKSNDKHKKANDAEESDQKEENPKPTVDIPKYSDAEIDGLIQQMRSAKSIYDRRNACIELGNAEATQAIPDMIHALEDDSPLIRKAANESLIKITKEDFGFNPTAKGNVRAWAVDRWKKWYDEIKKEDAKNTLKSMF